MPIRNKGDRIYYDPAALGKVEEIKAFIKSGLVTRDLDPRIFGRLAESCQDTEEALLLAAVTVIETVEAAALKLVLLDLSAMKFTSDDLC